MSIAVIGLGPMGGGVGLHLHDLGREVIGVELDPARADEWSAQGPKSYTTPSEVPWEEVDTVIVAARLIDQVRDSLAPLIATQGQRPLRVVIITTLAVSDAREYLPTLPRAWRVFEFPVSGGPEGARDGSLSAMLAGPVPDDDERDILDAIAVRIFETSAYGEPAALKLLNNTLGAYVAMATGQLSELAGRFGISAQKFLEVARASSGQSWMADHFEVFHHPLLIKDVHLLRHDLPRLPVIDLNDPDQLDGVVLRVRADLSTGGTK